MSYDISLCDPVTGKTLAEDSPHQIAGGTRVLGGTKDLWLNITYNYAEHFALAFGDNRGIRSIYGMSGAESIPLLKTAISRLGDDVAEDYWAATEGNVKQALNGLLAFAQLRPDGIWKGD